jgi:hypothetical protein
VWVEDPMKRRVRCRQVADLPRIRVAEPLQRARFEESPRGVKYVIGTRATSLKRGVNESQLIVLVRRQMRMNVRRRRLLQVLDLHRLDFIRQFKSKYA